MNATAIILLVGVVSFWAALGLLALFFFRLRKTLESVETTLSCVQQDLNRLTPAITDTLQEVEKTGQEVGLTASEVRTLARKVNHSSAPAAVSGAVNYIPAVVGLLRLLGPLFRRRDGGR